MNLFWSEQCVPEVVNAVRDTNYMQCCSARFTFDLVATITPGVGGSTYFPNNCTQSPTTAFVTIGPMVVDTEVVSDSITVDDELLINGQVFQAGQYLVSLGAGATGTGATFAGGQSACNGQHTVGAGTVVATVPQGQSVTLAAGDNHGIDLFIRGALLLRPAAAP